MAEPYMFCDIYAMKYLVKIQHVPCDLCLGLPDPSNCIRTIISCAVSDMIAVSNQLWHILKDNCQTVICTQHSQSAMALEISVSKL